MMPASIMRPNILSIWFGTRPPLISTPSSMFRLKAYFVRFALDRNS